MKSGSAVSNAYSQRSITFSWSLSGQSIEKNQSTISWTLKGSGGSTTEWYYAGPINLTVDGKKVLSNLYPSGSRIKLYNGTLIASGTATIDHDSEGKKTFSISFDGAIYESSKNVTGSGSFDLPTIQRASSFGTIEGSTIGNAISIAINRASSSYKHKVYYSFGSISKTLISTNVETSLTWTPDITLLGPEVPGKIKDTCTLYLETFNGSTKIGDTVTKVWTLSMPDSAVPTVSSITVEEANSDVSLVISDMFLQSLSRLKITTAATGIYGSSISSCSVTFENVKYSGSSVETNAVKGNGDLTVSVTVTDSRGRTSTESVIVSVQAYTAPQLTSAVIRRNAQTTTTVNCIVSGSVTSIKSGSTEKNTCEVYILYSKTKTYPDVSSSYKVTTSGISFSDAVKNYTGLSNTSSYYFKILVRDKFNETYQEFKISTAAVIIDFNKNGYVGIGKYRENGVLDIAGDVYADGGFYSKSGTLKAVFRVGAGGVALQRYEGDSISAAPYYTSASIIYGLDTDGNNRAVAFEDQLIKDTGWITAALNSPFAAYGTEDMYVPRYRKIGNIVHVYGTVKTTSTIAATTTEQKMFTLPAGYRPKGKIGLRCQGSMYSTWFLTINTDGTVCFSRYGHSGSGADFTTSNWAPFSAVFCAA